MWLNFYVRSSPPWAPWTAIETWTKNSTAAREKHQLPNVGSMNSNWDTDKELNRRSRKASALHCGLYEQQLRHGQRTQPPLENSISCCQPTHQDLEQPEASAQYRASFLQLERAPHASAWLWNLAFGNQLGEEASFHPHQMSQRQPYTLTHTNMFTHTPVQHFEETGFKVSYSVVALSPVNHKGLHQVCGFKEGSEE